MNSFTEDDVVSFLVGDDNTADVSCHRYDELMHRTCMHEFVSAITNAIDETFGPDASSAYTKLNELNELAQLLASTLIDAQVYKSIRDRIKHREEL